MADDHASVSVEIACPADELYDLVTDVSGMGRFSSECTGGRWLRGATGPAVGARFKGTNRRGRVRWSTVNKVVAARRGEEFAFETEGSGARWRYRFDPSGDTTVVTESREMYKRRPLLASAFVVLLGGARSHDAEMDDGLGSTLQRLKAFAERSG